MKSRTSSKFGQIPPLTAELAALGRLKKNLHRLIMGKMMSPLFLLLILGGNEDMHKSLDEFEFLPGLNT